MKQLGKYDKIQEIRKKLESKEDNSDFDIMADDMELAKPTGLDVSESVWLIKDY